MNDIFSNKEDLITAYANKRKNFNEEEVEDLVNCLLNYLKKVTSDGETYAVRIGKLGYMYKKFKPVKKQHKNLTLKHNHTLMDKMMLEVCLNNDTNRNPLIRRSILNKDYYKWGIEEIQNNQNSDK